MKYRVLIREVHVSHRIVEADSAESALELASHDGEEVYLEYSHTLDRSLWTVETVDPLDSRVK